MYKDQTFSLSGI